MLTRTRSRRRDATEEVRARALRTNPDSAALLVLTAVAPHILSCLGIVDAMELRRVSIEARDVVAQHRWRGVTTFGGSAWAAAFPNTKHLDLVGRLRGVDAPHARRLVSLTVQDIDAAAFKHLGALRRLCILDGCAASPPLGAELRHLHQLRELDADRLRVTAAGGAALLALPHVRRAVVETNDVFLAVGALGLRRALVADALPDIVATVKTLVDDADVREPLPEDVWYEAGTVEPLLADLATVVERCYAAGVDVPRMPIMWVDDMVNPEDEALQQGARALSRALVDARMSAAASTDVYDIPLSFKDWAVVRAWARRLPELVGMNRPWRLWFWAYARDVMLDEADAARVFVDEGGMASMASIAASVTDALDPNVRAAILAFAAAVEEHVPASGAAVRAVWERDVA